MSILLIYPPTAKICEPPAGIARLAGALKDNGVKCFAADLNLECMLDLMGNRNTAVDTWSKRAVKNRPAHLENLRSANIYNHPDTYRRAVKDLNRLLSTSSHANGCDISLTNYTDQNLSPLVSANLLLSAEKFKANPFFNCFSNRLGALIETHSPNFFGISFSYLSQALVGFAILGYVKHCYPSITTIAGGSLITSWMSSPNWNNPFSSLIDHLVRGQGEEQLLKLTGIKAPEKIGRPDYSHFQFSRYLAPGPILPYGASDGCYWNKCTFCPDKAENNRYYANSPERVQVELSDLISRHKPVLLHFLDNAVSPSMLKKLASSPPGVPWYGFARIEKNFEDPDFCHSLKNSGCIMLKLGLESGSQMVLQRMEKGIELGRVSRVLKNLKKAGIATYIYLLFGTPFETEKEAGLTLNFIKEHHECVSFLNLAIFNMPVCSSEAADIPGRFTDGDLSLYCDFRHPFGWDRKSVRSFLHKRFKKDPCISKIIQRDPPFFTSNHAPLFFLP